MHYPNSIPTHAPLRPLPLARIYLPCVILLSLIAQGCASSRQSTFASPDDAVQALVGALRMDDLPQLGKILGPESDSVLSSGDAVADREMRERFVQGYDEKHQLTTANDGSMTLTVTNGDWPFPVPLVKEGAQWRFDTPSGVEEILNRRVGQNELTTIQVCLAIVDAEREYAQRDPDGDGLPNYAGKLISDQGTKNGLFWPTSDGEEPSPLGPLAAAAADEGYTSSQTSVGHAEPFHGYRYRLLTEQGPAATGGEMEYLVNGKLIGGFAIVAYPAIYGNSGVMTFIVSHEGIVFQNDLGPRTSRIAREMKAYDPGEGWKKVDAEK